MAQAKGVLPNKADDREVLYKNPQTCGYFIELTLGQSTEPELRAWLDSVDGAVDQLVAREAPEEDHPKGRKVASVATGFAPSFFDKLAAAGIAFERPAGFTSEAAPPTDRFAGAPATTADALFYVATTMEARVNEFLALVASSPAVQSVSLERGYQRPDETEPFGYRDGVRNVVSSERLQVVYVHVDGDQPDEPSWADGGTYMVNMKLLQNPAALAALGDPAVQDTVIGRRRDGTRLDTPGVDPHEESADVPEALPPTAHIRKAGPRGQHDDTQIFRRGMPFLEASGGQLQVGLHFCSFQATPAQFDTVFNDWMMNSRFPNRPDGSSPGPDALMTTTTAAGPLVQMLRAGIYFVPPARDGGLSEVFAAKPPTKRKVGRIAVNKVILDSSDPSRRFERGGFGFEVRDASGATIPGSQFSTESSGRGVCPAELTVGGSYQLVETTAPLQVTSMASVPFEMDKPNKTFRIENQFAQPGAGGYAG